MRGRADGKGRSAGQKDRSEETRGQRGWEGGGLRTGADSPEFQDRGEGMASLGARRPARPPRGQEGEGEARGRRESISRQKTLLERWERGTKQS